MNPYEDIQRYTLHLIHTTAARNFSFADCNKLENSGMNSLLINERNTLKLQKKRKEEHIPTSKDRSTIEKLLQVVQKNVMLICFYFSNVVIDFPNA